MLHEAIMKIEDVRKTAYSMPLTNPSFPPGPYRFYNREYFVITYRTDPEALAAVVPEPLEVIEPVVKYEFIRMPDSTGFGDYTETGQVIPVRFNGVEGGYTHAMYLDDEGPIAGGRELWGFPKKLARPKIEVESDVLVGTSDGVYVIDRQYLTTEESYETYYDSLEGHWGWWVRIEGQLVSIPPNKRAACDREVQRALAGLVEEKGIPYTIHCLHVKLRS